MRTPASVPIPPSHPDSDDPRTRADGPARRTYVLRASIAGRSAPEGPTLDSRVRPEYASALADLYRHAAALADAGDIAGARTLHEAIGRLLGDERAIRADVIDLNAKRRP
jgi:hypothetical protein